MARLISTLFEIIEGMGVLLLRLPFCLFDLQLAHLVGIYNYDSFQGIKTKSEESLWCFSLSLLSKICPFSPKKHWNPSLICWILSHSTT